jgi:hypothetical protein
MHAFLIFLVLVLVLIFQIRPIYGIGLPKDSPELQTILAKYWSWWGNSPEDDPEKDPTCSMGIDSEVSSVFFVNPFEVGDVFYDCTGSPIPKGYSIMFPLLAAFCSQGDKGLYNKSYDEIRECTLNLDRGKVRGIVSIDDKAIVNISKDNGNGIDTKPVLKNFLPQYSYYKEIFSNNFVDLLTTNNTIFANNWEHPEEFEKHPVNYKAVVHCECVIIDSNDISPGNHTLKYTVNSVGGKSSIDAADTGWQFTSTPIYHFTVK